jgi:ribosomal subunit interface protein
MDVRVKATGYQMTPDVSDYLDTRLATLEKLLGADAETTRCEVELGRDAGNMRHGEHVWFAEITLRSPGGASVRATNRAASINAAIDDVKEEAERQLRREKQAHIRIMRKSGAALKRLMRWGGE